MSVETIRVVLGRLQDDPESEAAWNDLAEAVTAPGVADDEAERLLGLARAKHEQRREWGAVAKLLDLEISFVSGTPVEAPMQAELARIYHEELCDVGRARDAYKRLLAIRPDDATAEEALENDEAKQAKWRDLVARYVAEAEAAGDDAFKSVLYASAADVAYRYGGEEVRAQVLEHVEQALRLDAKNKRAASLGEIVFAGRRDFEGVARMQEILMVEAAAKEDRLAAALRLGHTASKRLDDRARAMTAYEQALDLSPGQPDALAFLAEAYTAAEQWDHLVALYEDQLQSGTLKPEGELGVLVQIAMVHWRMRGQPAAAEPYFDRVRRAEPAHAGMLSFFREHAIEKGDKARLATILTDAQRATSDPAEKAALATEIAQLAESQENAAKAIEQYKTVLRTDPENRAARDALKRLYAQTEGWNALIELHRQDLERTPAEDVAGRVAILREIAAIYRDRARNDAALVTALGQIVQLDDKDVDAVRELAKLYEQLGRFRDLLAYQQKLAELTTNTVEKANLYRAAARRWLDQFSNVQNAIAAYEGLLEAEPEDPEAQQKLRELYTKRRAWPQLFALCERQLASAEDAAKIELLQEMAKLAAERLDRGADAIALMKQVLALDPTTPGAFDALEKLAERDKDYATVAEVLERRVEVAGDDPTRLAALQKLGAVYAEKLKDQAATSRTWRRVLELSPGHARALRVLREAYVSAGDWDGLEQLYASQRDFEGLVDFLSSAADKASDPETKIAVSFRAARIYETELGAPERATRSYERVLSASPSDARAAAALAPIYEKEEKWARLPALYEILLGATEDEAEQIAMLRKLAAVTGGPLADKNAALAYARRAYELSPDTDGLELLEAWSRAAGSWAAFVEAVEARLKRKKGLTNTLKRTLRLKLVEVYARELGKLDEAVAGYRELVEADPSDDETVRALDGMLRAAGRRDDLRWLFELRADQVEGEARADILEEWAALEEEVFGDPAQATALLRKVLELVPARITALRALARLLVAAGDHAGAAEIIARHRDACDGEERARRELELATIYEGQLARPADALEACVRALALSPHDRDAIALLSRLVEHPETRLRAASVLESEYAESGDSRREAQALRVMLEAESDPEVRKGLYTKLADVEELKLSAAGTAFDVVLRALLESPDDLALWDRAGELAAKSGRPTDLAEAYRVHLVGATRGADGAPRRLPEETALELCDRAATLHDEKLGDPEGALPYLERVLAAQPTNQRAFARLKQILTAAERWGELEELYDNAARATTLDAERIDLLNEVALIAEEIIADEAKAIGYYERILALDPLYPAALDALEKLYERAERWKDLAALVERRLEMATEGETADYELLLGRLYLDRLHEPERAMPFLEDVLRLRESDPEARQLVERMLEVGALRGRAARVLETVYENRDEIRSLVRVLEIRREVTKDEAEQRELLRRISVLRDERLRDDPSAFAALAELVPLEPEDAALRERFVEIGRRLGAHEKVAEVLTAAAGACERPTAAGEILMDVARIHEDLLGDSARAEAVYQRVLTLDPGDATLVIPAARALARIYAAEAQHEHLAEVLAIEVRLEDDPDARRALWERIGTLYETVLEKPAEAIAAFRARLEDDANDVTALAALERLYEKTEAWRDLVSVLRAREQATSDGDERRRAMIKAAETLAGKLGDVPEAISAWRVVLDELGPERPTLAALAALYEKDERWVDLAETLEVDLSLADETAERIALLARLGDVRRLHRDDLPGALEAYREALVLDPSNAACRGALEALLENADARRDAAEILHPLYEADGDAERLLRVLEIEADASESPADRLDVLEKARSTAEGPLGDAPRAFGYAVRGVREAAGEDSIARWIETAERLTEKTGKFAELCALFREVADSILDGDVQQSVRLRIGELARTKLDDKELAIASYRRALDERGDDRRALVALEELYAEKDAAPELLEILKLRVEGAEDDDEKKKLLFRVAELQKGPLGDGAGAIATYESILDVALDPAAIAALEGLYAAAERWGDFVALHERRLDGGVADAADLHVQIAVVAHRHMGDVDRAFDELGAALADSPAHEAAVAELEKLLRDAESPEHRARAGEMLEPVYLRRADWAAVKTALDARLADSQDPGERRDLLTRLATLYEEQLEDYQAALDTVAKLLHEDLADESVWHELERLAKVAGAEKKLAGIYAAELEALSSDDEQSAKLARRTGEMYADLGFVEPALRWYRRAHEFEPESRELFDAIDALLVKEKRHEERAALYRAGLDHRDGEDRLAALHTIAKLEREELHQPEKAIETYRAALDVDENDATALDALTELYRELGRDRDLADLYLRRAESAESPERAAPYRLALARLSREKLDDVAGAIDQLEAIVGDVPWHEEAIKELESLTHDGEHKARVVEILRPLYERADDWRLLVKLNDERFALASDAQEKVAILRETASLWENRGGDRARAFAAVESAFALDPEDGETRAELERLAEATSAWEALATSYEQGAASTSDDVVRRELLSALAKVYDERIDDPRRALGALGRLSELDATDPEPLDAMDTLSVLLGDWASLIRVLEKKSELANDEENAAIWRRIAETKLEMMLDEDGAITAYERSLELDPESVSALDALIELYEARDAAKRLVELYARRVELAGDDADLRYDLLVRAAKRHEEALGDRREAIAALGAALEARPGDAAVLASLERLFRAESMWDELLENLKQQAALADSTEQRTKLRAAIGDLYAKELESPSDALEQYRLVLDDAPKDEHAIAAVRAIGEEREELRLDAAEILEPVLRAAGRHEDLVAALELRLRAQTEPTDRARTLRAIATVQEEQLSKPDAAEAALLRALEDTPDDASLHADIERLSRAQGSFTAYADALEQRAAAIFDGTIAKDLWVRLGRIAEQDLKDDRRAVAAHAKAVEHAGDDPELLEALDRLHERLGDAKALADVLERRVSVTNDDHAQADLYHRLARIQIDAFADPVQGLATLRMALERAIDHEGAREALEKLTENRDLFEEAAEVLEGVYRARGDNAALARLYDKRIGFASSASDRVRMRLDLARVLEERSNDAKAAQSTLEKALSDDPTDDDVLAELERLAGITSGFAAAADALEKAVASHDDLAADVARDLWLRIAGWRKDRIDDAAGAERALEQALARDATSEEILRRIERLQRVPGRERDLVATLRKLAALDGMGDTGAELRREAKTIAQTALSDAALAEEILREMIAADDGDVWALAELSLLREQAGDFKEVHALLVRQAELAADAEKLRSLRHAAAAVARDKLADDAAAIALYEQLFEDEPSDAKAAQALRELYGKGKKHKELLALLGRLVDLAETPAARAELRLESATLCVEFLDALGEAIEHLRAVLDEDPGHAKATMLLSQLLEKAGRDDELAELLSKQIELAKERGDVASELAFSVRLGEVSESRLNDVPKAIATYRAVLDRDERHTGALLSLARLYEQKGDKAQAAEMLERILATETGADAVRTALRLADLHASLKDDAAVRRVLETALGAAPRDREVRDRLAALYEKQEAWAELTGLVAGDAEAAEATADKVRLYKKAADIHLAKRKDPGAAADLLAKATELQPGDRDLLLSLCDAYSASGRGKQAAEVLQKIVESYGGRRSKDLASIHMRLAKAYMDEDKDKALAELETAFKIDPGSVSVLRELGLLSLELAGDGSDKAKFDAHIDRAQKTFRALLLQKLDDAAPITKAEVFYWLGEISHRQKDDKKAIQMLDRALDNDKGLAPAKELLAKLKK